MSHSLQARLYAKVAEDPQRKCLAFIDGHGEFIWQSRGQFYSRAAAYASSLGDVGCEAGDVCILVLPSDEFCATMLLAILIRGAAPLLIAPPILQQGPNSNLLQILKGVLERTSPKVVIAHDSLEKFSAELAQEHHGSVFLFGEKGIPLGTPMSGGPVTPSENATFGLQLTSGTTGFPRICVWQQRNVLAALDGMADSMGLTDDDICFNWTPLYHDMGLVNNFFLCLSKGLPLAMLRPTDFVKQPARWLKGLHDTESTITWSPNFGYAISAQRIKDRDIAGIDLGHVRSFWNAAERIHLDTVLAFHDRFKSNGVRRGSLKMNFGCAENVGGATFSALDKPFVYEHVDVKKFHEEGIAERVPESRKEQAIAIVGAGRPHPNLRIKISSGNGEFLPDGHIGEVLLETPSRMTNYLGQADETSSVLRGDFISTGDLGYTRNGELFWTGRIRERMTVRGKKIDPSEFEGQLLKNKNLRPGCFAVFGIDDQRLGTQRLVLITELRNAHVNGLQNLTGDIREQLNLSLNLNVSEILLVEKGALTKTSSGKRRHQHFKSLYLNDSLKPLYKG